MLFVGIIKKFGGVYTGSVLGLPAFKLVDIWGVFGSLSGKGGLITVFKIDGSTLNFYHVDFLPRLYRGRRHGQNIAEPNSFAAIIYIDLIGRQSNLRAVDIKLCIFIKAVALFKP